MKLKIILLYTTFLYGCSVMAQVTDAGKKSEFYQQLIIELGVDKDIPVFYKTSLSVFRRVDLKNNRLNWENKGQIPEMWAFLNKVNINRLSENELLPEIKGHPFVQKKYQTVNSLLQPFLELSPVIYSNDKSLALCSVYHWSDPEAASETIYLLEYKFNKWIIIKSLLVAIS